LDESERKIRMCRLVLGSHKTEFHVGTSDRLVVEGSWNPLSFGIRVSSVVSVEPVEV